MGKNEKQMKKAVDVLAGLSYIYLIYAIFATEEGIQLLENEMSCIGVTIAFGIIAVIFKVIKVVAGSIGSAFDGAVESIGNKNSSDSGSPSNALTDKERECPYCAEIILAKAKICKHCGKDVTSACEMPTTTNPTNSLHHW